MRRIAVVGMIILGLVAVPLIAAAKPAPEKVEICHVTGDGGAHVIEVSTKAMQKHMDHGDTDVDEDGTCLVEGPIADSEPPLEAPTATINVGQITCAGLVPACSVTLDARSSDGVIDTYTWEYKPLLGLGVIVSDPSPDLTIPYVLQGDMLSVHLTVAGPGGESSSLLAFEVQPTLP